MILQILTADFSSLHARIAFVNLLSATIEGKQSDVFKPYQTTPSDDHQWTLDMDNNWWLSFPVEDTSTFKIHYRYQCKDVQAEEALAGWLCFRFNATIVQKT